MPITKKLLDTIPCSIRVIRKLSSEVLDNSISLMDLRILILVRDGLSQTEMANVTQVSKARISKLVNSPTLIKMIKKTTAGDRRSSELELTDYGEKELKNILKRVEKKMNFAVLKLSQSEKEKLYEGLLVLEKLTKLMKEV